jgi:hypothetical protein
MLAFALTLLAAAPAVPLEDLYARVDGAVVTVRVGLKQEQAGCATSRVAG